MIYSFLPDTLSYLIPVPGPWVQSPETLLSNFNLYFIYILRNALM